MAVYTTLTTEEIEAALSPYHLGQLRYAKGIAEGSENTNYLIGVAGAQGEEKYILTLYEKRVREQDLPFFLSMMDHLSTAGVPCPVPLKMANGGMMQTIKNRAAALVTFLPGASLSDIAPTHAAELGRALARMHLAAGHFTGMRDNDLSLAGWETLAEKIGPQLDSHIEPGLQSFVKGELDYLREHWPADLPGGVIHGDLFPDNALFSDGKLTGIIDYYFACNDSFMYDLAICLNAWCFDGKDALNFSRARALLNGYSEVRALSLEEKDALPILARGAALRFLLTRAHDRILHPKTSRLDPLEYVAKLRFHQQAGGVKAYGI